MDFRPISRLPKRSTWSHGSLGAGAPTARDGPYQPHGQRRPRTRALPRPQALGGHLAGQRRSCGRGPEPSCPAGPGRSRQSREGDGDCAGGTVRYCRGRRFLPPPRRAGAVPPGRAGRHRYSPGAMGDWSQVVPAPRGGPGSASCSGPLPPPQPPLSTNPPSLPSPPPEAPPSPSPETPPGRNARSPGTSGDGDVL